MFGLNRRCSANSIGVGGGQGGIGRIVSMFSKIETERWGSIYGLISGLECWRAADTSAGIGAAGE